MAIKYSLAMRPNPLDESAPKKAYAQAQTGEVIDLDKLCEHIVQHNSVWGDDIVNGVVRKLVRCVEELLVAGNAIELGNLGRFYTTIHSTGAVDFKSFTTQGNIKRVSVCWAKSDVFKDLRTSKLGIKYERVLPRKVNAENQAEYYGDGEEEDKG